MGDKDFDEIKRSFLETQFSAKDREEIRSHLLKPRLRRDLTRGDTSKRPKPKMQIRNDKDIEDFIDSLEHLMRVYCSKKSAFSRDAIREARNRIDKALNIARSFRSSLSELLDKALIPTALFRLDAPPEEHPRFFYDETFRIQREAAEGAIPKVDRLIESLTFQRQCTDSLISQGRPSRNSTGLFSHLRNIYVSHFRKNPSYSRDGEFAEIIRWSLEWIGEPCDDIDHILRQVQKIPSSSLMDMHVGLLKLDFESQEDPALARCLSIWRLLAVHQMESRSMEITLQSIKDRAKLDPELLRDQLLAEYRKSVIHLFDLISEANTNLLRDKRYLRDLKENVLESESMKERIQARVFEELESLLSKKWEKLANK